MLQYLRKHCDVKHGFDVLHDNYRWLDDIFEKRLVLQLGAYFPSQLVVRCPSGESRTTRARAVRQSISWAGAHSPQNANIPRERCLHTFATVLMQYSTLLRPCNAVIRYNKFNRRYVVFIFSSLQVLYLWSQGHIGALNYVKSRNDR